MDEEDLIKRTKNSFKAKKSKAEILESFQEKGYKLAYAEKIISQANKYKKIRNTFIILLAMVLVAATTFLVQGHLIENKISAAGLVIADFLNKGEEVVENPTIPSDFNGNEIKITPEFLSFLLKEAGALENLHRSIINFENPVINFQIGDKTFNSEVSGEIMTVKSLRRDADIQFNMEEVTADRLLASEDPEKLLRTYVSSGEIEVNLIAGKVELGSKGYLKFYESLK